MNAWTRLRFLHLLTAIAGTLVMLSFAADAQPPVSRYMPPLGMLAGMTRTDRVDANTPLHVVIELEPKDGDLEALAAASLDPASPQHHEPLTQAQFIERFARSREDVDRLAAWLRANGARDVYVAANRLVVAGTLTTAQAEGAFKTKFAIFAQGDRTAVAPTSPLTLPVAGIRAVRGVIAATDTHLADVPARFTTFRGAWYTPAQFREAYDALPNGGEHATIALIEDAGDRFDLEDLKPFLSASGAPPGASAARVSERLFVDKPIRSDCGRDDRGQEPSIDVDAALTMAPLANIEIRYEDLCARGDEGTVALERVLDQAQPPSVIVLPIVAGPVYGPTRDTYGPPSIPYLEAALRGIPIVVPAGDDGAYGYHIKGIEKPAVAYPCVLPYVICAGGTQLGERTDESAATGRRPNPRSAPTRPPQGRPLAGPFDEGPWNDGANATGGGISADPRPAWQTAPEAFEFSPQFVKYRIVPDVCADAAGHLRSYWHDYGFGGVAGTSESAAIVAAEIAAVNSTVPPEKRITGPGDLYALARSHPEAFRDVVRENDRGYIDNTIRPRILPPPLDYRGALPSPPPLVQGCAGVQPEGCTVKTGYDAVTGIGSIKERAAAQAL
jgi:subtilase family serine protease